MKNILANICKRFQDNMLNDNLGSNNYRGNVGVKSGASRASLTLLILFSLSIASAWGAEEKTGSYAFSGALASGWSKVGTTGEAYCSGWGCKNSVVSFTVRTTNNISNLTSVLTDAGNHDFSLEVVVNGVCNSGTNKCSVTLLNSSNEQVGSLTQEISNQFGSGNSSGSAKDVKFTFTPTTTVARIQVTGYNK